MRSQNIVSPEDQSATFVELFFDLVFVFSVTQIVTLLHHDLEINTIVEAILVFWLVWWAWTQFTWALNAADTTHQWVEFGTLLATGVAFFMAIAVPDAFHGKALWFAVPYVLVRSIGLILYIWVSWSDALQRASVRTFAVLSLGGLAAVLVGSFVGENGQLILWGLAIILDLIAASIGGRSEGWNLHPEHFSERHGLFVIIALGETLIVAASGLTGADLTSDMLLVAVLVVALACSFWWVYFINAKEKLEHAMARLNGGAQSSMARDIYSFFHFPMLCGVIAFALAVEEVVTHPTEPLALEGRLALAIGILLFVGGMVVAMWRATHGWMLPRLIISVVTAGLVLAVSDINPAITLAIALAGIVLIAVIEQRELPEHLPASE